MRRVLLLAAIVYVVARLLVVVALGDVFFYGEELEKGAVGLALTSGVDVPTARMPFHPYEGGGFVASVVKAVAFALFGTNVLAHKMAAIGWGLLVLSASVALAMRHAGRGAAIAIGALLALAPAHFQRQSLLHLGIHYEALLFIALVLDLGLRVAATPEGERPSPRLLAGLGLAAGFGTYFSYQVPLAVLPVIVLLAIVDWRRIFAPPLVVATLVGLVPLGLMALAVGNEVLDIHGSNVGGGGGAERFSDAIAVGLSRPAGALGAVLGALAIGLGLVASPPTGERRRAVLLVTGFVVLWSVAAIASGMIQAVGDDPHWVRFIRFAPLVFALLLLVALSVGPAIDRAATEGRKRVGQGARLAGIALVALGAAQVSRDIEAGDLGAAGSNLARLRGASGVEVRGALIKIVPRLVDETDEGVAGRAARAVAPYAALDDPRTAFLAAELAAAASHDVGGVTPDAMLDALDEALPDRFERGDLALGIGAVVHRSIGGDMRGALSNPALDPLFAEALGRHGGAGFLSLEPYVPGEIATVAGTAHEAAYLRGLGRRVFRCSVMQAYWGWELRLRPDRARVRLETVARDGGATDAAVAALLDGFDGAARDLGLGATTLLRPEPAEDE